MPSLSPINVLIDKSQKKIITNPLYKEVSINETNTYYVICVVIRNKICYTTESKGKSIAAAKVRAAGRMCKKLNFRCNETEQYKLYNIQIETVQWKELCAQCKLRGIQKPLVFSNQYKTFHITIPSLKLKSGKSSLICCCFELLLKLERLPNKINIKIDSDNNRTVTQFYSYQNIFDNFDVSKINSSDTVSMETTPNGDVIPIVREPILIGERMNTEIYINKNFNMWRSRGLCRRNYSHRRVYSQTNN